MLMDISLVQSTKKIVFIFGKCTTMQMVSLKEIIVMHSMITFLWNSEFDFQ